MPTAVTNFGKVTASTGYDAVATSVVLSAGHGSRLPSVAPYPLVWWNSTDYPDPADDPNKEIVTVTARSTDTLTITRASESTSASTKNTGGKVYKLILGMTKAMWEEISAVNNTPGTPIINGNMNVWQRGTSFAAVATGTYTADRWGWNQTGAGVVTISQSSSIPTIGQAGVLFAYSLLVDVTTADASLATTDTYAIYQKIEGFNWRHFAQRDLILSFWVKATKTGLHSVGVCNSGIDRGYVGTYTVLVADTWEFKSVVLTASPSAGTWNYDTGVGLNVFFNLGAGTNFQITAGSWQTVATNIPKATSATVNDMDSTANFFSITGVKIELGTVPTPIQYRPFDDELLACQRYYQKSFQYITAPVQSDLGAGYHQFTSGNTGAVSVTTFVKLHTTIRTASPTVVIYNIAAANTQMRNLTDSADFTATSGGSGGENMISVTGTGNAGLAVGEQVAFNWTCSAEL